jgi:hypothetical protein
MLPSQCVSEFHKLAARILRSVGNDNSVVKMNLDLTPTGLAMFCELLDQTAIVLLGRIKIRVNERMAIAIAPSPGQAWVLAAP